MPMQVHRGESDVPAARGAAVTIGVFDGVHRGHQEVLANLRAWATELGVPAGVITFAQHPRKVLDHRPIDMLTTTEHRLLLFERAGIDFTWLLDFTEDLSRLDATTFAQRFLVDKLQIRCLDLGFDSRFGCDRIGADSPGIQPLAQHLGFQVRCLQPVLTPEGKPISSTLVRQSIWEGRLRDAEAMLGRRVSVYGIVVKGDARGRRLGYPTINLDLGGEVRPPFGVYVTLCKAGGKEFGSVTNVGYRPTVSQPLEPGEKPDLMIETHLFDYSGDLYGQHVEVSFVEKLRDEQRFPDVQALVEQIKRDEEKARLILRALHQ